MNASFALQQSLQTATEEYKKLQVDLSNVVEMHQRLDAQLSENELVKKEFARLTSENTVYKLIGPVLVPQDQAEAQGNVDKRLDFIRADIKRTESQLKEMGEKSERKKLEIAQAQTSLQRLEGVKARTTRINEYIHADIA